MLNDAIETLHTSRMSGIWIEGKGEGNTVDVLTRWFNDRASAEKCAAAFLAEGCYFARVFEQRSSALGPFRVAGHKLAVEG